MNDDPQDLPENERVEGLARRAIAAILSHDRSLVSTAHACTGFDEQTRCTVCGRDGNEPAPVITVFAHALGRWWWNASGGGSAVYYVPAYTVMPVLRAYLAQRDELRKLRAERERSDYQWLAAQKGAIDRMVERALLGEAAPAMVIGETAPGGLTTVRAVADEVWAIAKGLGVSDIARRLKGLASRLHELSTEKGERD